ncbi:xylose isomerase [Streptomyces viridochromogenes]|uniref:Xylose isomerase n=1 Tax=Streptomyces viridochromogenes TaxID=1938 RepID=A0A0J7ZP27_STRVR|nr:metabolite traffic protein EboE [Streptomyces viridochromogenes]KMS76883.1 xylose isomerase [Streptomyces viridochromogenes]KOG22046.1 xylose isomerase [Streptomyces viridochromogenes]KOG29953.1 xylose isomerase [Streptomyces viridochromogenes]
MRFLHPDGTTVHLGYCSNVHQAEDLEGVIAQLADHAEPVRERLGTDRLGIGLWLARPVVTELADDESALARLRTELRARGLETVTLNAFPYAGFHREVVKKDVYEPDWADEARLNYTLDCARVLAALLPDHVDHGSVSTLPLAWRTPWTPVCAEEARHALDRLTTGLAALEAWTGRRIRVGFEPEPGCVVETTTQAVRELGGLDPDRLGICLDACHLAVQFEQPAEALRRLAEAGMPVVKLQASCAVEAADPADPAARAALHRLAEPRFLHQTRTSGDGDVLGVDDLPDALAGELPADAGPWRVHFHAPLHTDPEPPLRTTADQLDQVLAGLLGGPSAHCDHIEVETYTWSVLPDPPADLAGGIAAELAWARDRLTGLGLKEDPS